MTGKPNSTCVFKIVGDETFLWQVFRCWNYTYCVLTYILNNSSIEISVWKFKGEVLKKFFHSRNGAERSGLFCVALYVAQQIKTQQKVDVFSAVKHVRLYRPQCIPNEVWCFSMYIIEIRVPRVHAGARLSWNVVMELAKCFSHLEFEYPYTNNKTCKKITLPQKTKRHSFYYFRSSTFSCMSLQRSASSAKINKIERIYVEEKIRLQWQLNNINIYSDQSNRNY